jgi:hypothetical protein
MDYNEWLKATADSTEFFGYKVDLSRTQTIVALSTGAMRTVTVEYGTEPILTYNGEDYEVCRTDLKDDVATSWCTTKSAEEWREHYLDVASNCYGARINSYEDGRKTFCVVDSVSDG